MGINRNDPCHCGSGRKYKKCCLPAAEPQAANPEALIDAAFAEHQAGRLDAAAGGYLATLQQVPTHADALRLLATVRLQQAQFGEAIALFQRSIALHGPQRDSLYNLGNALRGAGQDKEAISVYRQLLAAAPDDVATLNNLGLACRAQRRNAEALACFEAAHRLTPRDAEVLGNLGLVLLDMNRIDEAIVVLREARALDPQQAEICNNLSSALQRTGDIGAALPLLEEALRLRPDYPQAHSNLIFLLDFVEEDGVARQQGERHRWGERYARRVAPCTHFANAREPERRLRIGYVSPDFRQHSAAYTFGPLLLHRDRTAFEVECFSNTAVGDDLTERFRSAVDAWHDIYALDDEAAARLIQSRQIDILVDLAGHSAGNRLGIFARRPAPVQVSGWGHANGTGLATMDYLFADPIYIPPADAMHYAEQVRYLPCALGYLTPAEAPPCTPLPALQNGYLTFGSFNRLSKINATTLARWIELLHRLPDSRLLMKTPELNSPLRQQALRDTFAAAGIAAERLTLQAGTPWYEHLAAMRATDIALDPFPHGGGVTVFDCLWMGVPVLAVSAAIPTGRLAASVLHAADLDDWVARDADALLDLALTKAADLPALAALRDDLRSHLQQDTVIGDPARYARAVEKELRQIWRTWCETAS